MIWFWMPFWMPCRRTRSDSPANAPVPLIALHTKLSSQVWSP